MKCRVPLLDVINDQFLWWYKVTENKAWSPSAIRWRHHYCWWSPILAPKDPSRNLDTWKDQYVNHYSVRSYLIFDSTQPHMHSLLTLTCTCLDKLHKHGMLHFWDVILSFNYKATHYLQRATSWKHSVWSVASYRHLVSDATLAQIKMYIYKTFFPNSSQKALSDGTTVVDSTGNKGNLKISILLTWFYCYNSSTCS